MNVAVGLMDGLGLDGDQCIRVIPRQIRTQKMMMGHRGVSEGDEGPGVTQDPGDQKDLGDPKG